MILKFDSFLFQNKKKGKKYLHRPAPASPGQIATVKVKLMPSLSQLSRGQLSLSTLKQIFLSNKNLQGQSSVQKRQDRLQSLQKEVLEQRAYRVRQSKVMAMGSSSPKQNSLSKSVIQSQSFNDRFKQISSKLKLPPMK